MKVTWKNSVIIILSSYLLLTNQWSLMRNLLPRRSPEETIVDKNDVNIYDANVFTNKENNMENPVREENLTLNVKNIDENVLKKNEVNTQLVQQNMDKDIPEIKKQTQAINRQLINSIKSETSAPIVAGLVTSTTNINIKNTAIITTKMKTSDIHDSNPSAEKKSSSIINSTITEILVDSSVDEKISRKEDEVELIKDIVTSSTTVTSIIKVARSPAQAVIPIINPDASSSKNSTEIDVQAAEISSESIPVISNHPLEIGNGSTNIESIEIKNSSEISQTIMPDTVSSSNENNSESDDVDSTNEDVQSEYSDDDNDTDNILNITGMNDDREINEIMNIISEIDFSSNGSLNEEQTNTTDRAEETEEAEEEETLVEEDDEEEDSQESTKIDEKNTTTKKVARFFESDNTEKKPIAKNLGKPTIITIVLSNAFLFLILGVYFGHILYKKKFSPEKFVIKIKETAVEKNNAKIHQNVVMEKQGKLFKENNTNTIILKSWAF